MNIIFNDVVQLNSFHATSEVGCIFLLIIEGRAIKKDIFSIPNNYMICNTIHRGNIC